MGEIAINPIHNVHKQYRQMIFANPYRFGIYVPPVTPNNTFIGGVASAINTPALLAAKLLNYPSGTSFSATNITNFTIVGDDIECYIGVDYQITTSAFFNNITSISNYFDNDGKCRILGGQVFYNSNTLKVCVFPNLIELMEVGGFRTFANCIKLEYIYAPKCILWAYSVGNDNVFNSTTKQGLKIYAEPTMATINSGGVEGDLAYVISTLNGTVTYVTDFTAPNPITDLTIGDIYATALQLNFTAPTGSTNAIDFYEVYNGSTYLGKINTSGDYITGLTINTTYANLEVKPIDIYYNKSTSNIVSQTTGATYVIPTANIVSNWQMENNVLDSVGTNHGTATSITYVAGLVGQAAIFDGSTSIITVSDASNLSFGNGTTQDSFSIVANLYMTLAVQVNDIILEKANFVTDQKEYLFYINSNGKVRFTIYSNNDINNRIVFETYGTIPLNRWMNIIVSCGSDPLNDLTITINGAKQILTKTQTGTFVAMIDTTSDLYIGSRLGSTLEYQGYQDELSILNIALNDGQSSDTYAKLLSGQHLI